MFNRGPTSDNRPPELQNLFQPAPASAEPGALVTPVPQPAPMAPSPMPASAAEAQAGQISSGALRSPRPRASAAEAQAGQISIIGADLMILGEKITVITKARLLVDGEVRGDINGKEVIVGQTGRVTGTVAAHSIEVHGHVYGAVKAQAVTLHPTSVVEGDIFNQTLKISEGAVFDGRVRRVKDAREVEPILDPAMISNPPTT